MQILQTPLGIQAPLLGNSRPLGQPRLLSHHPLKQYQQLTPLVNAKRLTWILPNLLIQPSRFLQADYQPLNESNFEFPFIDLEPFQEPLEDEVVPAEEQELDTERSFIEPIPSPAIAANLTKVSASKTTSSDSPKPTQSSKANSAKENQTKSSSKLPTAKPRSSRSRAGKASEMGQTSRNTAIETNYTQPIRDLEISDLEISDLEIEKQINEDNISFVPEDLSDLDLQRQEQNSPQALDQTLAQVPNLRSESESLYTEEANATCAEDTSTETDLETLFSQKNHPQENYPKTKRNRERNKKQNSGKTSIAPKTDRKAQSKTNSNQSTPGKTTVASDRKDTRSKASLNTKSRKAKQGKAVPDFIALDRATALEQAVDSIIPTTASSLSTSDELLVADRSEIDRPIEDISVSSSNPESTDSNETSATEFNSLEFPSLGNDDRSLPVNGLLSNDDRSLPIEPFVQFPLSEDKLLHEPIQGNEPLEKQTLQPKKSQVSTKVSKRSKVSKQSKDKLRLPQQIETQDASVQGPSTNSKFLPDAPINTQANLTDQTISPTHTTTKSEISETSEAIGSNSVTRDDRNVLEESLVSEFVTDHLHSDDSGSLAPESDRTINQPQSENLLEQSQVVVPIQPKTSKNIAQQNKLNNANDLFIEQISLDQNTKTITPKHTPTAPEATKPEATKLERAADLTESPRIPQSPHFVGESDLPPELLTEVQNESLQQPELLTEVQNESLQQPELLTEVQNESLQQPELLQPQQAIQHYPSRSPQSPPSRSSEPIFEEQSQSNSSELIQEFAASDLPPQGFSVGGHVTISRSPAKPIDPSDTVPAMLAPGEFVVNVEDAQKHLPLLHHINQGGSLETAPVPIQKTEASPSETLADIPSAESLPDIADKSASVQRKQAKDALNHSSLVPAPSLVENHQELVRFKSLQSGTFDDFSSDSNPSQPSYTSPPRIFRSKIPSSSPSSSSFSSSPSSFEWSSVEDLLGMDSEPTTDFISRSATTQSAISQQPVWQGFAQGGEVAAPPTGTAPVTETIASPNATETTKDAAEETRAAIETLAQEIYSRLQQRLMIERERQGFYSGRLPW